MSDMTVFANNPSTTATGSAGTTTTDTTWAMTDVSSFPVPSSGSVPQAIFHIADPAKPSELITVTDVSSNTWTVTRGAEGTTAVAHASGATYYQVVTAADLTGFKQATGAITSPVNVGRGVTETAVCTYQPVAGEIVAGTTLELIATGSIRTTSSPTSVTWNIRWGWVSSGTPGTSILSMLTGANCPALVSALSTPGSFDLNGTVTFITTTSAIANINFWWQSGTTTFTGVASSAAAVTGLTAPPGGGPLVLTAKWTASATSLSGSLAIPGPLAYRAA